MNYKPNIHYSVDLERAVIGACILEKTAFGRVYGILQAEHFYQTIHQIVFKTLSTMWFENRPIDLITVSIELARSGYEVIEKKDSDYELVSITRDVVSSAHLEYHSLLLRQMFIEREMIRITSSGVNEGEDPLRYMDKLQNEFTKLRTIHAGDDFRGMDELLVDLFRHMDMVKGKELAGATTGFKTWDNLTGGLMPGGLYLIAARPSVGKSSFMGKMAISQASLGTKVSIISLEMDAKQITARISSLATEVEYFRIYRSMLRDEAQAKHFYEKVSNDLAMLPIRISDKVGVDIGDIKAKIAILKQRGQVDILYLDYLQLIESDQVYRNSNREQEVARMSRGLKLAAKEFDIPIVVISQLNRMSETTGDKKPKLHNLRESGALEQDADGVVFLHRDWMSGIKQNENGESTEYEADIIIAKWRDGQVTEYKIGFNGPRMEFYEFGDKPDMVGDGSGWMPFKED